MNRFFPILLAVLLIAITGANSKAVKSYMFGLDYLKLVKAK